MSQEEEQGQSAVNASTAIVPTGTTTKEEQEQGGDENNNNNNNNNNNDDDDDDNLYVATSFRWIPLFCLCTVGGINSAQQVNFAALIKASKSTYGMTTEELDWLVSPFYLSFLLFSFLSVALFERHGLRFVLLGSSLLNTAGALLKLVAVRWYDGYYCLLLAQVVSALAQPLYMPLPPALAVVWFPDDQRAIATTLAALCTALGTAFGEAYSGFIVTDDGTVAQFVHFLTIQAVCSSIETIINLVFMREEPDTPPSAAAALRRLQAHQHHHLSICERMYQMIGEVWKYFKQPNKALLLVGGGILVGTLYAVPAAMCQLFLKWGISNQNCGIMAGLIILVGMVVGTVAGLYVDKTKKYRSTLLFCVVMGCIFIILAGVVLIIDASQVILVGACVCVGGAPLLAAFGIVLDASSEECFPLDEVFSSSGIVFIGALMAIIDMNIVPVILDSGDGHVTSIVIWGIFFVCLAIGGTCIYFWEPELPRVKFEQLKKELHNQHRHQKEEGHHREEDEKQNISKSDSLATQPLLAKN